LRKVEVMTSEAFCRGEKEGQSRKSRKVRGETDHVFGVVRVFFEIQSNLCHRTNAHDPLDGLSSELGQPEIVAEVSSERTRPVWFD